MIARLTSMNAETLLLKRLEKMTMRKDQVLMSHRSMDVGWTHMEEERDIFQKVVQMVKY